MRFLPATYIYFHYSFCPLQTDFPHITNNRQQRAFCACSCAVANVSESEANNRHSRTTKFPSFQSIKDPCKTLCCASITPSMASVEGAVNNTLAAAAAAAAVGSVVAVQSMHHVANTEETTSTGTTDATALPTSSSSLRPRVSIHLSVYMCEFGCGKGSETVCSIVAFVKSMSMSGQDTCLLLVTEPHTLVRLIGSLQFWASRKSTQAFSASCVLRIWPSFDTTQHQPQQFIERPKWEPKNTKMKVQVIYNRVCAKCGSFRTPFLNENLYTPCKECIYTQTKCTFHIECVSRP